MSKFKKSEIKQRERDLIATLDAKNLIDLQERRPDVVKNIQALLEVGLTYKEIGRVIRDPENGNPQMWVESKFAESVARAILAEEK